MAVHVDIAKPLTAHRLREGLNALLRPDPVAVLTAERQADDWHARFSCIGRRYLYRIANRRAPLTLDANRAWRIEPPLYRRRVDFYTKSRAFDITRARTELGYHPQVDLREGIRRTIAWYRAEREAKGGAA